MDWLSRLLDLVAVHGHLDIRCLYGSPWRLEFESASPQEVPYHIVLSGSALLENPEGGPPQELKAGDILILPNGSAHTLHDGSGKRPFAATKHLRENITFSRNGAVGERLDMLCGRFIFRPPHDRALRDYLPSRLVVSTNQSHDSETSATAVKLSNLVALMRAESAEESLGGRAMLDALSTALFALTLRLASQVNKGSAGLLTLAGNPRLAPALSALFSKPGHPWTLPELANLCNMSRATFARHFQDNMGRSASDFLTGIRMTIAARELKNSAASVETVAELVGYQSDAAFHRAFKLHIGITPAQWRRAGQSKSPKAST